MDIEVIASIIQLILAPAVMLTSCAILLGGIHNHYAGINQRLRALAQERLQILRTTSDLETNDPLTTERLQEIDTQIPDLVNLYQLVRNAILIIYLAIAIFLADMLIIALAILTRTEWTALASLLGFLVGTLALLWGSLLMVKEVRASHRATHFEVTRVLGLNK